MRYTNKIRLLINQLKYFRLPLIIFLLSWIAGFIVFLVIEENKNFWHIFLMSICINPSEASLLFFKIYQFLMALFFELIFLSFILSILQEVWGFNPILRSRKLASNQKNHTVVLGYNHLGERIVDYLREHKKRYSVIEILQEKIEDLINLGQPVVIGDYTDKDIINLAAIKRCKEIFCVTSDLRRALIAAERVRELNKTCDLYMRVFDPHFREYLNDEPWNAFTFSSSKWAMNSVKKWSENISDKDTIIVLGNDTIVHRIVEHYGIELKSKVYIVDPEIDPEVYNDLPNVQPYREKIQFIENLEERFDLKTISQIYICWNTEESFSDAIILMVALKKKYPILQQFVRIFDEELADIAESCGVITFSTSAYAFQMLQEEVKSHSGISPVHGD